MYLHIGNDYSVKIDDILGIFDLENTTVGKYTKEYLERAEKEKCCVYTTFEMPKSFITVLKNGKETVYISQLSVSTLRKRLDSETHRNRI
jgi:hypothetical protein